MKTIKILIVEDHALLRETWSFIINNDPRFEVTGLCGNAETALTLIIETKPDVVMMDINLPGMNGIEATILINQFMPAPRVLAVSMHIELSYVRKMLAAGAAGYLSKNATSMELLTALDVIGSGGSYVGDEIKDILFYEPSNSNISHYKKLSPKELQVINFLKEGLSSKQIAQKLGRSVKTVEVHRHNILKKLELKNTAALINYINQNEA